MRGRPKKEVVKSAAERKTDQRWREKNGITAETKITQYSPGGLTGGRKIKGKPIASGVGLAAFDKMIGNGDKSFFGKSKPLYGDPETREKETGGFNSKWERGTAVLNAEYAGKKPAGPAGNTVTTLYHGRQVSIADFHSFRRWVRPWCMTDGQVHERSKSEESVEIRQDRPPAGNWYIEALRDACEMAGTANKVASVGRNLLPLESERIKWRPDWDGLPLGKDWDGSPAPIGYLMAERTEPRRYKSRVDGVWRVWHVSDAYLAEIAPVEMRLAA
jgi:hypothetical protein